MSDIGYKKSGFFEYLEIWIKEILLIYYSDFAGFFLYNSQALGLGIIYFSIITNTL